MPFRSGRTVVYTRRSGSQGSNDCVDKFLEILLIIIGITFLIGVPLYSHHCEQELFELTLAFEEASEVVISVDSDQNPKAHLSGELLHVQSSDVEPDSILSDRDFDVSAPNALKMKRNTEYCQWMEHYTESREKRGEEEIVTRTYYYTKGWHSYRIPSFAFDQPFRHNNPQRDPTPYRYWQVEGARLGDYTVDVDIINSISSYKEKQWQHEDIIKFTNSPAALEHNFKYIGDGYFYSAYSEGDILTIAKLAGQYLEGSLLDIQLFDLFPQCTPGDIRVYYTSIEPSQVTAIGLQKDAVGSLGGWRSSRNYLVALLGEGFKTADELMQEYRDNYLHWTVWVSRAFLIIWATVVSFFLFPSKSFIVYLVYGTSLALFTLGFIWTIISPSLFTCLLSVLFIGYLFVGFSNFMQRPNTTTSTSNINLSKTY